MFLLNNIYVLRLLILQGPIFFYNFAYRTNKKLQNLILAKVNTFTVCNYLFLKQKEVNVL